MQDNWGREGRERVVQTGEEGMGIVQNGGGCGLSGNGNISGEVTRVYL